MRVVLSQVKAVPTAQYGFVPRCIPWEVKHEQNPDTGVISSTLSIFARADIFHAYPTAEGTLSFFPMPVDLADSPVPVLTIAVVHEGELLEDRILKEIVSEDDWAWLQSTHGVTKQHLGVTP